MVGLLAVLLAACGSSASSGDSDGSESTEPVSMAIVPVASWAPMVLGREEGFFKAEGIDLQIDYARGGAAIIPAVVTGEYDFGGGNLLSSLVGSTQDLPIKLVGGGAVAGDSPPLGLLARGDSDIQSFGDLAGKTVAVNTLNNHLHAFLLRGAQEAGIDPSSLQVIETEQAAAGGALDSGQVDAVLVGDPIKAQLLDAGAREIVNPFVKAHPELPLGGTFTSTQFARENPELTQRFVRALNRSYEYANENSEAVAAVLPEFTDMEPADAKKTIVNQTWGPLKPENLPLLADLVERYEFGDGRPKIDALLWKNQ